MTNSFVSILASILGSYFSGRAYVVIFLTYQSPIEIGVALGDRGVGHDDRSYGPWIR